MNPVRIVSINGSGLDIKYEFHEIVFNSILQETDGDQIAIISTFGSPKIGKTFLLNLIRRYLTATQPEEWLEEDDPDCTLEGFPWSDKDPASNRGVWISSEPITVIGSFGQTVEIFLMDSKGTSDDKTTVAKEMEIFTAICVQLSSCTVFNTTKEISNAALQKLLEDVTVLEVKVGRTSTDGPHFVFCVRDFENSRKFQHGTTGGHKYLQQTSFKNMVMSKLPNSSCVLLPFPGELTQWRKYNGNTACLERNFVKILDEFIPATFDADCLLTLARTSTDHIQAFARLSQQFGIGTQVAPSFHNPTPRNAYNSTTNHSPELAIASTLSPNSPNYNIYMDALNLFQTRISEKFQERNVNEGSLNNSAEQYRHEAVEQFTDSDLKGNFRDIRAEEEKLTDDIKSHFQKCLTKWKNDQTKIVEEIESKYSQAISFYEEEMEEFCKIPNQSRAALKRCHTKSRQLAEEAFHTGTVDHPIGIVEPFLQKLNKAIELKLKSFEQIIEDQEAVRREATNSYAETVAIQVYHENMRKELKCRSFFQPEDLEILHQRIHKLALTEFQNNVDFESIENTDSLTSQLNDHFQRYKNANDRVKLRVEEEVARVSSVLLRKYESELTQQVNNPRVTLISFDSANEMSLASAKSEFSNIKNEENACIWEESWIRLMNQFRAIYARLSVEANKHQLARTVRHEKEAKELVENLLNLKKKITPEILGKLTQNQLKKLCAVNRNDAILTFNENVVDFDEEIQKKYLAQLEEEIEIETSEVEARFKMQTIESQLRLKAALLEAKNYYDLEMGKKFIAKTTFHKPAVLLDIHEKIFSEIKTKFGAQLFPPQLKELYDSLDPIYNVYKLRNDMNTPNTTTAIGIDLGTTYSCVAVYHAGEVKILQDENGKSTTPSYFSLIDGHEVIGHESKAQAYIHPRSTVYDAKRILAKDFTDPTVQADIKNWSFEVIDQDGSARIRMQPSQQIFEPERISSKILKSLKNLATKHLRTEVKDVVITVPAYFNDGQRNATKDAGELAGLNVLSIINEPTAAALSYFWDNKQAGPRNVLVYDLGGGTFDVSVLTMQDGDVTVLATGGDGHLGGEDFDNNMIDYCLEEFRKKTNVDLKALKTSPNAAVQEQYHNKIKRLKNIVEEVKISLAYSPSRNILLEAIHSNLDLNVPMSRTTFESLNQSLFDKTLRIVKDTLERSGLNKEQIHEVILIGGSSKILKVKEMLREYFGNEFLDHSVNPDEAVAKGAAIQAAILSGNEEQRLKNISLQDVTPLALGIGYSGDKLSVIIPRNTTVPVSKVETFYKASHSTSLAIKIYEGEQPKASDNHYLGTFSISGLTVTDEDEQIDVTMSISAENILSVTAEGNGISKNYVVQRKGRMTAAEKRRYLDDEVVESLEES